MCTSTRAAIRTARQLLIQERFHRIDFAHMELEITNRESKDEHETDHV
jgi:hypothetical protein